MVCSAPEAVKELRIRKKSRSFLISSGVVLRRKEEKVLKKAMASRRLVFPWALSPRIMFTPGLHSTAAAP